ncbi:Calvin cycle protein CP12-2, chloroplastic [Capsicum chinense]|uniref:Calvin cycle protein CP12-2, chloroplastic n=1 Tax=Capsicum annuum TaxID=4072 RepID=A0A1U8FAA1_CAPAN|nr:calvin cycle protein CP12-2, chloroplastic [Capsicum annuum]KAF3622149.1 Calvin cycle protein CP12-2, chloroplastic [Capsicum annuum]KAF3654714.1 Calvin cycle protein CP12-2, chloroplastic [Capsicum annuum]PHT77597.1 Calvin cycle protein CP12-2, chloroplastic [Capsicum annuum]PHU13298.1 Calvin cycle protein CP12-2, chloroplastic [Capsicum chinense]
MASSIAGVNLTTPAILSKSSDFPKIHPFNFPTLNNPWKNKNRKMYVAPLSATPDNKLSDLVAESVKEAEQACADDPVSGECAAAWDVVEEASAAASHARDRKKESSDPLENYCKDNPETDECRTYDN